jgi:hypothetical protein
VEAQQRHQRCQTGVARPRVAILGGHL